MQKTKVSFFYKISGLKKIYKIIDGATVQPLLTEP